MLASEDRCVFLSGDRGNLLERQYYKWERFHAHGTERVCVTKRAEVTRRESREWKEFVSLKRGGLGCQENLYLVAKCRLCSFVH